MELSNSLHPDGGDRTSPAAPAPPRARQLLEKLLVPVLGGEAGGVAADLLGHFGSLGAVFAADERALARVVGTGSQSPAFVATVREAMLFALREEAFAAPVLSTASRLLDYLRADMGGLTVEQFRVLYLNGRNHLLLDEVVATGTINHAAFYPREIVRRALDIGATALILAHNHPSGDPSPSESDLAATRRLIEATRELSITVHDHIIVTLTGWTSLRGSGAL
jgi:DNA repair protein RadC